MEKLKTRYGTFKGDVFYARVFEQNKDNADFHAHTQGQYNCVFVPESEEELQKLLDFGFPTKAMGSTMVREYDVAAGRKGVKLKRPHVHKSGIEAFGGAPTVTKGISNEHWDMEADGELGNGTSVVVKISIYGEGSTATVRLEKVAVMNHIPYERPAENEMSW